jgi:bacteriocin biosynthesis cyclodehydratase domain-containing protein
VLNGRQTASILDALRPMLNGEMTLEDVRAALDGVSPSSLIKLLSVLNEHGFLKDGPADSVAKESDMPETGLFRNWLEVHGAVPRDVEASLAGKRVCMAGEGEAAAAAAAVLRACRVRVDSNLPQSLAGIDLLVFAAPGLELGEALRLNRLSLESGIEYLPLTFDGTFGLIGPVVRGRPGPCLNCLLLRREANSLHRREERRYREWRSRAERTAPVWLPGSAQILGHWGAELALRRLAGIGSTTVPSGAEIYRVDFLAPSMTSHRLRRVPFCPACSAAVSSRNGGEHE